MPGLVGFVCTGERESECAARLQRMQSAMVHTDRCERDKLFLGKDICATRVHNKVIQSHCQPYYEDGLYIWLDGEFYNQDALAKCAEGAEHSDPALLAALIRKSDDFKLLREIDGIYSAVIYDACCGNLHLISDRFGLRHLNWSITNGRLAWASELKALLELPGIQAEPDADVVEEFLEIGWLLENHTWFSRAELLPAATVLTWNIDRQFLRKTRYWWWDDVAPLPHGVDENELAEEAGRLFADAVRRRCRRGERIALTLSGGLDSRAILAAMPDYLDPVLTVTTGRRQSDDVAIAAKAAKTRGASHHVAELNPENWFFPRVEAVWWTDGRKDIQHMGALSAYREVAGLCDIVLDGAAGGRLKGVDLAYSDDVVEYLKCEMSVDLRFNDRLKARVLEYYGRLGSKYVLEMDSVLRSYSINGPKLATFHGMEFRLPFLDNRFQEFLYAAPKSARKDYRLCKKMLLGAYPKYFERIPWQATGLPISKKGLLAKAVLLARKAKNRVLWDLGGAATRRLYTYDFALYALWLREEPARSFVAHTLGNPAALYQAFIPAKTVRQAWERHLGGADCSKELFRYLTFEIWLQQVFEGKHRPVRGAEKRASIVDQGKLGVEVVASRSGGA